MFSKTVDRRKLALTAAKNKRKARAKKKSNSAQAIRIQTFFRRWNSSRKLKNRLREDWDKKIADLLRLATALKANSVDFSPPGMSLILLLREFLFFYHRDQDLVQRLPTLCALLIRSIHSTDPETNFTSLAVSDGGLWRYLSLKLFKICVRNTASVAIGQMACAFLQQEKNGILSSKTKDEKIKGIVKCELDLLQHKLFMPTPSESVPLAFSIIRISMLEITESLGQGKSASDFSLLSKKSNKNSQKKNNLEISLRIIKTVIDQSKGAIRAHLIEQCNTQIMTIPLLAANISSPVWKELFAGIWTELLCSINVLQGSLQFVSIQPSSSFFLDSLPFGGSSLYLLGNLLQLNQFLCFSDAETERIDELIQYIMMINGFLLEVPTSMLGNNPHLKVKRKHLQKTVVPSHLLLKQLRLLSSVQSIRSLVSFLFQPEEIAARDEDLNKISKAEMALRISIEKSSARPIRIRAEKEKRSGMSWDFIRATSKWAKKLFSSDRKRDDGPLANTSQLTRSISVSVTQKKQEINTTGRSVVKRNRRTAIFALSALWIKLLQANVENVAEGSPLLNTLAFSTSLVPHLWRFLESGLDIDTFVKSIDVRTISNAAGPYVVFALFCQTASHLLAVVDDIELHERGYPFHLHVLSRIVTILKTLAVQLYSAGVAEDCHNRFSNYLLSCVTSLLRQLFERSCRRPIARAEDWLAPPHMLRRYTLQSKTYKDILMNAPFLIPLEQRIKLFEKFVAEDRAIHQPKDASPGCRLTVNRRTIFRDAFNGLNHLGPRLRERVAVKFIGTDGRTEAGQDLGGLFKELWTSLSAVAFNPDYGLLRSTEDGLLYPNPDSYMVVDGIVGSANASNVMSHEKIFEFLGRVLGKALYEGVVVQPQFARHFLRSMMRKANHLDDLVCFDKELFKNLIYLKSMDAERVQDLCLDFTVTEGAFGANKVVELCPGGKNIDVNEYNRIRYVFLVAHYHLNQRTKIQTTSFLRGLRDIIKPEWLSMFSEPEMQLIISGDESPIDIADLRKHTRMERCIPGGPFDRRFWRAVESFSANERALLLRFVTSCERQPRLGFQSLQPPFCVRCVSIRSNEERLPTASTCFNLLKCPDYDSSKVMREKILMVITSCSGFDLS
eukprot:g1197.t1